MHSASFQGHVNICKQLLARGSDAFSFDNEVAKQSPANLAEKQWCRLTAELQDVKTLRGDLAQERQKAVLANPLFVEKFIGYHGR